jgi:hypothetical protein
MFGAFILSGLSYISSTLSVDLVDIVKKKLRT